MTTQKSHEAFMQWLDEEIQWALEEANESGTAAMNSYGAGMDHGIYQGLLMVRSYFTGELE